MKPGQFKRLQSEFHRLAGLSADHRHAELAAMDPEVARELADLLRADAGDSTLHALSRPTSTSGQRPGRIGNCRIVEVLGEGGMGVVYGAVQEEPLQRRVAVKLFRRSMDSEEIILRFERERQALAIMSHPAIAKVFDAGVTDHREPYFVMEYVDGAHLDDHCDYHRLGLGARIELMIQVCDGVQHAHQKGVVHRDLKPGNILVDRGDTGRDQTRIIDFGIARAVQVSPFGALGPEFVTEQGEFLGTPEFMAPEQAEGAADVDSRADVYSLGVLLYQLLTGALPFESKRLREGGVLQLQRILRDEEPLRASARLTSLGVAAVEHARRQDTTVTSLRRRLQGDLDWVIAKAMAKDPRRRYPSAHALAADLRCYLASRPVSAGPLTVRYCVARFLRRNRMGVAMALAVLVVAGIGIAGTILGMQRAADRAMEFDMLAATVRLDAAERTVGRLYPAWPASTARFRSFLAGAVQRLVRDRSVIADVLRAMRSRSSGRLAEGDELWRESFRHESLVKLRAEREARSRAIAVCRGERPRPTGTIPEHLSRAPAEALLDHAWQRVAVDGTRKVWGEEVVGLACAERAAELGSELTLVHSLLRVRAYGLLAVGAGDAAISSAKEALDLAPLSEAEYFRGLVDDIERRVAGLRGSASTIELRELDVRISKLESGLDLLRAYEFPVTGDQFLHDALRRLHERLDRFVAKVIPSVERRFEWASGSEAATVAHPSAGASWAEVAADLMSPRAESPYHNAPIRLRPQVGLVPIGRNPVTGLWEFYHLRSAWLENDQRQATELPIPRHDPESGNILMTEETGMVFVLVPGGTAWIGSQGQDEQAPGYDRMSKPNVYPRQVTFAPFFVARHEVTKAQWMRLTNGGRPSLRRAGYDLGPYGRISWVHPVEQVTWRAGMRSAQRHGLALPTEAEFEYFYRAGTTTPWWCGGDESKFDEVANLADQTFAEAAPGQTFDAELDDRHPLHSAVGSFRANAFGLFDVMGNCAEWCRNLENCRSAENADGFTVEVNDPEAVKRARGRGGHIVSLPRDARATSRMDGGLDQASPYLGVRFTRRVFDRSPGAIVRQ